jgi:hypothetical protein
MTERLRHEHIVRINDPANAAGAWLTREQLWAGLQYTVLEPQVLDESIDSASVRQIVPGKLWREIRRGPGCVTDEVELVPNESLRIRVEASGVFAGSTLTMRIEEPAPEMLFVRFTYEVCGLPDNRDEQEDAARCNAYQTCDIERVRQARRYVAQDADINMNADAAQRRGRTQ